MTNNITLYKQQSAQSSSPEVQALEEENIELLKENKELRKEVAVHKATIDKTIKQASTTTTIPIASTENTAAAAPASPRQFGTDLGKRIHSIDNIHNNTHTTDDNDTTTATITLTKPQPTTTTTLPTSLKSPLNSKPETRKMKSRRMSGPLANVGDENTPAECTQS